MVTPKYDKGYYPLIKALENFEARVKSEKPENTQNIKIAVERNGGNVYVYSYTGLKDGVDDELNYRIAERMVKTILWVWFLVCLATSYGERALGE